MSSRKSWIIFVPAVLLIIGCADKTPTVTKKPVKVVKETNTTNVPAPQRIYKEGELREVQDGNFTSAYMYPEDKVKKKKVVKVAEAETTATVVTTASAMNKEECVGMIGQEKFDKYTQMFGNEASSIKRCAMLKAMN